MKIFKYIIMLFLIAVGMSCDKTDLYAYPSSDSNKTDITAFSLLNEKGENVVVESKIDSETGTITVKATPGTSLNRLVPRAAVSEGVVIEPIMGTYMDFSSPVSYTLIAGDRTTRQTWTISVSF